MPKYISSLILTGEQPINSLAKIHLLNQYGTKSYLDACGYSTCSGQYAIQTSTSPDRDSGTGTWQIIPVDDTNMKGSIKYGDKVHLLNQYGTKSYLDAYDTPHW